MIWNTDQIGWNGPSLLLALVDIGAVALFIWFVIAMFRL